MIITLQTLIFFRESLLNALDRLLRPYFIKFALTFGRKGDVSEDDESDEQVFAEFDEEKGVVFYPPVYLQRYAAVTDCLMDERWCGKLEKVVDLGYHDMSFIKYLKEVSGIRCILGVDIESILLRCSSDLMGYDNYGPKRETPLQVTLFQGNAADPDYRLVGCDAVIAIEMIEHMLPQDLDRLIHTVFGFIRPWVAIFTTPNGDFNVLFKAMEKNGFRRLDHFFEWSREQFHDWCSNIVARYPNYTVLCKGIGPGPPGTQHLGCCSQMAVFISKDYHKQQDLDLESLALVANAPSPCNVSELISWDNLDEAPNESNMICPPNNEESYTELYSEKQSYVTILIASPTYSLASLEYQDKTSQCNLDTEAGKNYLMFDYEQMCFNMVEPRRITKNRVYMIEDVTSRLNCTTLQVRKFSKTTQNLIAKNKIDSLLHTREVVDEIRHLTKMLNFNKDCINLPLENGVHIWNNINWGDNAPYWNQYYKVVREYNPPFETKSDDVRIIELISDEINRLIDNQYFDDYSVDMNRLEIPLDHLMDVVAHITDDVEKVKDLLEWDGYEIVDNLVIHSRMVVDNGSTQDMQEDDWPDNETCSDWDSTDVRSTTVSDGSVMVPDFHARCLRRALERKVRKLRTMLTADEDITTELDKVVCRLMKLALRTSGRRHSPPPPRWMQYKLLDLLTLTEKAIGRRKRYFIENYPLKSISYVDDPSEKSQEMIALDKIKEDDTGLKIVDKYRHLVHSEKPTHTESRAKYHLMNLDLNDDLSMTSGEFLKDYECIDRHSPSLYEPEVKMTDAELFESTSEKTKLERTQAWLEDDLELVPYPNPDLNFDNDISSGDTEHSTTLSRYYKKSYRRYKPKKQSIDLKCVVCKKSHSKCFGKESKKDKKVKAKTSKTKVTKKVSKKKSSYNNMFKDNSNKYESVDYRHYKVKPRKKEYKSLQPTASKPIPASLIELCHPELMIEDNVQIYKEQIINYTRDNHVTQFNQTTGGVATTQKSIFIDIVMDDIHETIAMRRTIGIDAEGDPMGFEKETLIRSVSNTIVDGYSFFDKHDVAIENDQTIFLNDINEPSTSKGIRHVNMDVQCGHYASAPVYSILSATTSVAKLPGISTAGIKIGDSSTDTKFTDMKQQKVPVDCCISTNDDESVYKTISPRERPIGITIKESDPDIKAHVECTNITYRPKSTEWKQVLTTKGHEAPTREHIDTVLEKKSTMRQHGSIMREKDTAMMQKQQLNIMKKLELVIKDQESTKAEQETNMREQETAIMSQHHHHKQEPMEKQISTTQEQSQTTRDQDVVTMRVHEFTIRQQGSTMRGQKTIFPEQHLTMPEQGSTRQEQETTMEKKKEMLELSRDQQSIMQEQLSYMQKQVSTMQEKVLTMREQRLIMREQGSTMQEDELAIQDQESIIIPEQHMSPTVQELDSDQANPSSPHTEYSTETKCLKSIPSGMKLDSGSEFCGSIASIPKSPLSLGKCLNSDLQSVPSYNKDVDVSRKMNRYVRPKLCCGGVQVHSYRDKQSSEDIMYQGEWQNPRPKVLTTRKVFKPVIVKKTTDSMLKNKVNSKEKIKKVNSKEKIPARSIVKINTKVVPKASSPIPNVEPPKMKANVVQTNERTSTFVPRCDIKLNRPMRPVPKVPHKVTMSSATSKITKTFVKKPSKTIVSTTKDAQKETRIVNKKYLPFYLRKSATKPTDQKNLNLSVDSVKTNICMKINAPKLLDCSKTEEIKRDLLRFRDKVSDTSYVVLRNEVEKKGSANDGQQSKPTPDTERRRGIAKRPISPQSQNSSTCSSPNSIATVRAVSLRAKNVSSRRHSNSSYKTSTANSGSENTTPNRNKKFTKRCKSAKMPDDKPFDNKENIPQTSMQSQITSKGSDKIIKGTFLGQKKEVFIAQLKESPPLQSSTNKKSKAGLNMPKTNSVIEKKSTRSATSKKPSQLSDDRTADNQSTVFAGTGISDMVLVLEPHKHMSYATQEVPNNVNSRLITEWMDNSSLSVDVSQTSSIRAAMRMLVEETLDFIDGPYDNNCSIDSETVILSREDLDSVGVDLCPSPISFRTVVTNENNSLQSDLEHAVNCSFDMTLCDESILSLDDTRLTVTDFELLSFKSITSVSKYSEYLSAGSSQGKLPVTSVHATSVKDIYERKDQPFTSIPKNNAGAVAVQAFSGFSINGEPIAGDKPDPINFVDSETGSMAVDVSRQANSEELFISGRSSGSFESCLIDEDAVVPSWLFQIISQQQAAEDEMNPPPQQLIPLPMPEGPLYDDNGNMVGIGAGAGDGRGIHSDQSQDSSGRGTSLSSSPTSSGQQSEAILLDPSVFVTQYDGVTLQQDSEDSSLVLVSVDDDDNEGNTQGAPTVPDSQSFSHGESSRRNPRVQPTTGSDDADVSSLETDVPDSSDN